MPRFSNFAVVFSMLLFIQASMMTVQAMPSSERRTAAPRMCKCYGPHEFFEIR